MGYIKYDIEKLKQVADCRDIARAIGIPIKGTFCQCAFGTHSESQLNHCAIYRDHIHCFSCGESADVIGMVKAWLKVDNKEACKIVADLCGGSQLYEVDAAALTKKAYDGPLSLEELENLCLQPKYKHNGVNMTMFALYQAAPVIYYKIVRSQIDTLLCKISELLTSVGDETIKAALLDRKGKIEKIADNLKQKERSLSS